MENKEQKYYGSITGLDSENKYVDAIILHFDKANENGWVPMSGCLDEFFDRAKSAGKDIPACYQHNDDLLIGQWRELKIEGGILSGRLYLDDIPFVRDTVIPQLKSGTIQGASPTIAPLSEFYNKSTDNYEVNAGVLCEISLVGIPADLKADITEMRAKIEAEKNKKDKTDFEFELLIL